MIGREEVGGYDVSRLVADDPEALSDWLDENGYTLPEGAEPILSEYVDEGWKFVAIRLAPDSDGVLKPLDVEFPTDRFVYPMKLSQLSVEPIDLTLFTLADGERTVEGLTETYSGPVDELDPAPPEELASLLAAGTDVTRLEATAAPPSEFTADLEIAPSDTRSPGRMPPARPRAPTPSATRTSSRRSRSCSSSLVGLALVATLAVVATSAAARAGGP